MADRIVVGFALREKSLTSLVKSNQDPSAIMKKIPTRLMKDLSEQLKYDDSDATPKSLIQEIVSGNIDEDHAYEYTRLVECLAHAIGNFLGKIDVLYTYYLPNKKDGCWNEVLRKLGLKKLAAVWERDNLRFPNDDACSDWPTCTLVRGKNLPGLADELKSVPWKKRLEDLEDSALAKESDAKRLSKVARLSRKELAAGLSQLVEWLKTARDTDNDLLLIMDGDQ